MMTRREILTATAALAATAAVPLPAVDADNDITILRQAYTMLHPGLYRYATPVQVATRLDRLAQAWTDATLAERYLLLSRFLGTVRCGHSYANFYNQKRVVADALFTGRNRVPFQFRWLDSRMIVTADPMATGLSPGDEVMSIDGRPAHMILAGLIGLARADGQNDGRRRMLLSVQAIDSYDSFDIYYPLVFPAGDRFALVVRAPDGRRRSLNVAAIGLDQRRQQRPPAPVDNGVTPLWTCEIDGRSAVMTMSSWGLYDSKWNWRGWLDQQFETISRRGVTALIIDLRRNEGGEDCGIPILARLIDRPTAFSNERRLVRYRAVPDNLIPYLDTWDTSFRTLGKDAEPVGLGWYRLPDDKSELIQPEGPRFHGKVIVLIGPENSSATFQFVNRIRQLGLGTLVGQPTGGNQLGINGGCFFFLRLPGSGLEADLPLIGRFPSSRQPDAGLLPHIPIETSIADIAAGRDAAMEYARTLAPV